MADRVFFFRVDVYNIGNEEKKREREREKKKNVDFYVTINWYAL